MWVGRAKQLWLTTPLAMKSPVPVVMSNSGKIGAERLDAHDPPLRAAADGRADSPIDGATLTAREVIDADQRVVPGEMRAWARAQSGAGHVLPAPVGEEPVVAAGDQRGVVGQRHPVGGFGRRPVVERRSSGRNAGWRHREPCRRPRRPAARRPGPWCCRRT